MATEFFAQGRIVWGHPGRSQIKKDKDRKPIIRDGKEVSQWAFGLAIPKDVFNAQIYPYMQQEAAMAFPGGGVPPRFAWKYKDGDGFDDKGKRFSDREGYAGNFVLTVSTESYAPALYKLENGAYVQIPADQIKCGDFVAVKITCKYNNATGTNTPGLYINPQGIVFLGYGTEIQSSGFDPDEGFAGFQPMQFQGMTHNPVMASAPLPQAMNPGAVGMGQGPAPMHAPVQHMHPSNPVQYQQPVAPLPAPAHDFVQNVTGQPMQQYSPGVPQNPQPQYNVHHAPVTPHMAPGGPGTAGGAPGVTIYPSNMPPGSMPPR